MAATDMLRGRQTATRTLTNRSGVAIALGDVVVIGDGTNDNSFTTTTTAHYRAKAIGVAMEAIASLAAGLVAIAGYVPKVNTPASVARESFLYTHTVAKEASGTALYVPGAFGQVLETGTDPEAILFGMPERGPVELDYVEITSDVSPTATTEATANTVVTATAITFPDAVTKIEVEFYSSGVNHPAGASLSTFLLLVDGGTSIGFLASVQNNADAGAGAVRVPVHVKRRLTPTAAAHTYGIEAFVTSGTGTVKAGAGGAGAVMPAFIKIMAV